ncbi:EthD domain-containing protein [Halovivax sp.]|uniref:EthD domain-containing protein n=1 Tax=Halovivax sp. TaxID=1935978 RepID=UPI0025BC92C1|nr:EthD domain-containing protein [Halovivax sp.]
MYKHVALLRRDEELDHEAFVERWRAADLAAAFDGVVRYHQVFPTMPEHAEFDGLAEFFFADRETLETAIGDAETPMANLDVDFADAIGEERGFAGEAIVQRDDVDGDTDELYKHSAFLVRKDDLTHQEFVEHWQENHTPIAREITGVVKYDTIVPTDPANQSFDGVAELYFDDVDALYDALGSEGSRDYDATGEMAEKARADVDNFLAIDERPRFIGKERLVADER